MRLFDLRKLWAFFLFATAILCNGCVNIGAASDAETPTYSLKFSEPDRIRFSGRGAGAGMMLAGSMGAMGIAIGVAIDEGIAKDIGETAAAADLSFAQVFKDTLAEYETAEPQWLTESESTEYSHSRLYLVEQYGFVVARGGDDDVYPNIVVQITEADGSSRNVIIPDDYLDTPEKLPRTTFDAVKTDASEIERLWLEGLALMLNNHQNYPY